MIAAAATRGDVTLHNVIPRHLEIIGSKLVEATTRLMYGLRTARFLRKLILLRCPTPVSPQICNRSLLRSLQRYPAHQRHVRVYGTIVSDTLMS